MISKKKHERFLYILLSIYTLLVMVFMLLLNGFFVKSKAYNGNFPVTTFRSKCEIDGQLGIVDLTFTASNNSKVIYIVNETDLNNEPSYIYLFGTPNLIGDLVVNQANGYGWYSSVLYTYNKYAANDIIGNGNFFDDDLIGYRITMNSLNNGDPFITDFYETSDNIEYVTSFEDAKKYIYQNDDSVVHTGNPINPPLPEDDSLPVPQKLGTDIQNDNVGTPPFISGSWENPGSIYASFDASEVEVEIQYKPVFQLYKKVFNIKLGKVTADDWIPVTKTQISNYTTNRFILYNAKTGYPNPFDSQTLHSGSLTDDIESVAFSDGYRTNMYNPLSARIANGTNWRIRYIIGNKTSLWVVFHVNSIGSIKNTESVSFENASGDSIAADDVNYTNSAQTETVDKLNVNNFFDSLNSAINGIFNTANNSMTAQDTEGSKGFYAMFKATFDKFPIFWTFFCLGLIVAILLRILGR